MLQNFTNVTEVFYSGNVQGSKSLLVYYDTIQCMLGGEVYYDTIQCMLGGEVRVSKTKSIQLLILSHSWVELYKEGLGNKGQS